MRASCAILTAPINCENMAVLSCFELMITAHVNRREDGSCGKWVLLYRHRGVRTTS